jgi:hypothetical protein
VGASVNYSPEFTATEPNLHLLKRLAEAGEGKVLPLDLTASPFRHDRKRTFQPRDLWEWLLKAAIVLFVLDVGIRRIQIDRQEWAKMMAVVRRTVLFWRGEPRPVQADESLAALLARRDQVRARHPSRLAPEPGPELFQPRQPPPSPGFEPALADAAGSAAPEITPPPAEESAAPVSTTSRLLEAKRRARKKME